MKAVARATRISALSRTGACLYIPRAELEELGLRPGDTVIVEEKEHGLEVKLPDEIIARFEKIVEQAHVLGKDGLLRLLPFKPDRIPEIFNVSREYVDRILELLTTKKYSELPRSLRRLVRVFASRFDPETQIYQLLKELLIQVFLNPVELD